MALQPVPEGDGGEEKEMVKEFSNGPGTKSFVPQGEGERFARGRKGKSLFAQVERGGNG